ncbi:hypothetical protein [Chakrabartyella piscis]|uniref:hypothetical protein n=1 Tax=Chakrabartyella piscis TaxID=2918914 RepID=UPI0029587326|nr:hypothetical protein [Chakrabartyella piscis]
MSMRKSAFIFWGISLLSLCVGIAVVAYEWGYLQSIIDHGTPTFSAPAYVSIVSGIPFIIVTLVFAVIAIIVTKRNRR